MFDIGVSIGDEVFIRSLGKRGIVCDLGLDGSIVVEIDSDRVVSSIADMNILTHNVGDIKFIR